jgi:hypothetical protein
VSFVVCSSVEESEAATAKPAQNAIKAETDCVAAELLARPGDGVSVDQPILRFREDDMVTR